MYAIIETGGKQYKVTEGEWIKVEKLNAEVDSNVVFDKVLLVSSDNGLTLVKPYVEGAKVTGTVLEQCKDKKVIIFKYRAKKDIRRKNGHRQPFTKVKINSIEA